MTTEFWRLLTKPLITTGSSKFAFATCFLLFLVSSPVVCGAA
jgi:hypothetical protein